MSIASTNYIHQNMPYHVIPKHSRERLQQSLACFSISTRLQFLHCLLEIFQPSDPLFFHLSCYCSQADAELGQEPQQHGCVQSPGSIKRTVNIQFISIWTIKHIWQSPLILQLVEILFFLPIREHPYTSKQNAFHNVFCTIKHLQYPVVEKYERYAATALQTQKEKYFISFFFISTEHP